MINEIKLNAFRQSVKKPKGRYKIKVFDKNNRLKKETGFCNLVCDQGLDSYNNFGGLLFNSCFLGTNNSVPVISDTKGTMNIVQTLNKHTPEAQPVFDPVLKKWTLAREYWLSSGSLAVGEQLTEIGVGYINDLFSRTLIKDQNGLPMILTLSADDYLYIYYEVEFFPPADTDIIGVIDFSGQIYDYVLRPCEIESVSWAPVAVQKITGCFASIDQNLSNSISSPQRNQAATSVVYTPYLDGSFEQEALFTFSPNVANYENGIAVFVFTSYDLGISEHWQVKFTKQGDDDPVFFKNLPKTNEMTLKLRFKNLWSVV